MKSIYRSVRDVLLCACAFGFLVGATSANGAQYRSIGVSDSTTPTLTVSGIPFVLMDTPTTIPEGSKRRVVVEHTGNYLWVLGGLNVPDRANPDWGGGDSVRNLFVGDTAGTVTLQYKSGIKDSIPLVFGYTMFWRQPYEGAPEPFVSVASARELLQRAVCVANATTREPKERFLCVRLRTEPLLGIEIEDNPRKLGYADVKAFTISEDASGVNEDGLKKWLETHTISSAEPYPETMKLAVAVLGKSMYTFADDITSETIAATPLAVAPENFNAGPVISFTGPPEALIFSNVYLENVHGMRSRIDEEGMVHESAADADYYGGFGGYGANVHAFWDSSYTRIRALTLAADMGLTAVVEKSLGFFDKWMMYFPQSFPKVQMGGKPVPGHATVVANKPHFYFDHLTKHGWHTKFKTNDMGNPENDGHGMLMLAHYRQFRKQGRDPKWVEKHWPAIKEAADYIVWSLENPELSLSERGLLYSESEGGMQKLSIYCDMPCYLGLLAYADMARTNGEQVAAEGWVSTAERMEKAMEAWYPLQDPKWGDIWDPEKRDTWFTGHGVLAVLLHGVDYWGYDVAKKLPAGWLDRTRRTYQMQLTKNQPQWCAPAGLGYGQCAISEAALLLDQMDDAAPMVNWLARFCFHPRLKHPYRVPEGVTMGDDAKVWRRWGDLGNLFQLGEVVYVARMIAGVDDTEDGKVKLMPRLPDGWTSVRVKKQPVQCGADGMQELGMRYEMSEDRRSYVATVQGVTSCTVRLGPFPSDLSSAEVTVNGAAATKLELFSQGSGKWGWVTLQGSGAKAYKITAEAK